MTKAETPVVVCGRRYVFGATANGEVEASEACPALRRDDQTEANVAAKNANDETAVAALVAQGVKPVRLVYEDGGQNKAFAGHDEDASRPDALVEGPTEIALDNSGKPIPAVVRVASADARPASVVSAPAGVPVAPVPPVAPAPGAPVAAAMATTTSTASASTLGFVGGVANGGQSFVKKWFGGSDNATAIRVYEPDQPIPADVPLPPRRAASLDAPGPQAAIDTHATSSTQ